MKRFNTIFPPLPGLLPFTRAITLLALLLVTVHSFTPPWASLPPCWPASTPVTYLLLRTTIYYCAFAVVESVRPGT